jgi:hypothetical protein
VVATADGLARAAEGPFGQAAVSAASKALKQWLSTAAEATPAAVAGGGAGGCSATGGGGFGSQGSGRGGGGGGATAAAAAAAAAAGVPFGKEEKEEELKVEDDDINVSSGAAHKNVLFKDAAVPPGFGQTTTTTSRHWESSGSSGTHYVQVKVQPPDQQGEGSISSSWVRFEIDTKSHSSYSPEEVTVSLLVNSGFGESEVWESEKITLPDVDGTTVLLRVADVPLEHLARATSLRFNVKKNHSGGVNCRVSRLRLVKAPKKKKASAPLAASSSASAAAAAAKKKKKGAENGDDDDEDEEEAMGGGGRVPLEVPSFAAAVFTCQKVVATARMEPLCLLLKDHAALHLFAQGKGGAAAVGGGGGGGGGGSSSLAAGPAANPFSVSGGSGGSGGGLMLPVEAVRARFVATGLAMVKARVGAQRAERRAVAAAAAVAADAVAASGTAAAAAAAASSASAKDGGMGFQKVSSAGTSESESALVRAWVTTPAAASSSSSASASSFEAVVRASVSGGHAVLLIDALVSACSSSSSSSLLLLLSLLLSLLSSSSFMEREKRLMSIEKYE